VGTQTTLGPSTKSATRQRFRRLSNGRNDTSHNSALAESRIFTRFNVITNVRGGTVSSYINSVRSNASLQKWLWFFPISKSLKFGNLILIAKND